MASDPDSDSRLLAPALDALRLVLDPELGVNIVDLGLVYDVHIEHGHARVTYTLTTFGCTVGPQLEADMTEVLTSVPGIREVTAELVMQPPWTRERMSPAARAVVGERELHPPGFGATPWDEPVVLRPPHTPH